MTDASGAATSRTPPASSRPPRFSKRTASCAPGGVQRGKDERGERGRSDRPTRTGNRTPGSAARGGRGGCTRTADRPALPRWASQSGASYTSSAVRASSRSMGRAPARPGRTRIARSPGPTIVAARLGAKAKQPSPLKGARYAVEFAAVAAFAGMVRVLPRRAVLRLGRVLGDVAYLLLRHDRRVAPANLDIVLRDDLSSGEKRRMARATFRRLASVVLGLFRAPRMTRAARRTAGRERHARRPGGLERAREGGDRRDRTLRRLGAGVSRDGAAGASAAHRHRADAEQADRGAVRAAPHVQRQPGRAAEIRGAETVPRAVRRGAASR